MTDHSPLNDTITAVATPVGNAGIGIIRISGPLAREIAEKIFRPRNPAVQLQTHRLYLGNLIDPATGAIIDEVLLSLMSAPHSYTREDVVEINSHSGYLLLSRILEIVVREGARIAGPGEFTYRAFINGRIDLTQAEAVVDLINCQSERGLQLATQQIGGTLKESIQAFRETVLDILAHIEAAVDFPDEEPAILSREQTAERMERDLREPIEDIVAAHAQRKIWMDGIDTIIVGCVNVGKSSLLNRLLNEEKAIVTPVPGTTRDIIESTVHIEGIPLRLMDTAGFREVEGEVERIGLRLTEKKWEQADLSLIVLDQSRPLSQEDRSIIARADPDKGLLIINKMDLPAMLQEEELHPYAGILPVIRISALTGEGIPDLRRAVRDRIISGTSDTTSTHVIPNLRHKEALQESSRLLGSAVENLKAGLPLDIIAADLQGVLDALGEIIGESTHEDLLDRIFSRFCLGK